MTVFNWGESPTGVWKLIIETRENPSVDINGELSHFSINFYGFMIPKKDRIIKRNNMRAFVPTSEHVKRIHDIELKNSRDTRIINKRNLESDPLLRKKLKN